MTGVHGRSGWPPRWPTQPGKQISTEQASQLSGIVRLRTCRRNCGAGRLLEKAALACEGEEDSNQQTDHCCAYGTSLIWSWPNHLNCPAVALITSSAASPPSRASLLRHPAAPVSSSSFEAPQPIVAEGIGRVPQEAECCLVWAARTFDGGAVRRNQKSSSIGRLFFFG